MPAESPVCQPTVQRSHESRDIAGTCSMLWTSQTHRCEHASDLRKIVGPAVMTQVLIEYDPQLEDDSRATQSRQLRQIHTRRPVIDATGVECRAKDCRVVRVANGRDSPELPQAPRLSHSQQSLQAQLYPSVEAATALRNAHLPGCCRSTPSMAGGSPRRLAHALPRFAKARPWIQRWRTSSLRRQ